MRRREFILALGGAAAWPLAARAQQKSVPTVGFLADGTPEGFAPRLAGIKRGLADLGFIEGQNVAVEPRWARRNYDLLPALASDLVNRHVAVILTAGSEKVTRAAKDATNTIPIVAAIAGDPVKRGLVASISRPGGNLTVVSLFTSSSNALIAKRVELLYDRQIADVFAFEDTTRINAYLSKHRIDVAAIAHETAILDEGPPFVEHWHRCACCCGDHLRTIVVKNGAGLDQGAGAVPNERRNGGFKVAVAVDSRHHEFDAE